MRSGLLAARPEARAWQRLLDHHCVAAKHTSGATVVNRRRICLSSRKKFARSGTARSACSLQQGTGTDLATRVVGEARTATEGSCHAEENGFQASGTFEISDRSDLGGVLHAMVGCEGGFAPAVVARSAELARTRLRAIELALAALGTLKRWRLFRRSGDGPHRRPVGCAR